MSIWESEDKMLLELIKDLGINEWDNVPGWIEDLAERLIDAGWRRK